MRTNLPYLAALHGLRALDAHSIKVAVDGLMNEGFYSDECLDALDSEPPRVDEVLPAFEAALMHYAVKVPTREEAVWKLIEFHLKQITSQGADPWDALCNLIRDVYWEYDFHSKTTQYLGDSHGIHHLVGIYWEIDDQAGESGKPITEFKPDERSLQAIRQAAEHWIHWHSARHAA